MITNDVRCIREIKSLTAITKAAFNRKTLFTSKLNLNVRKKVIKGCKWGTALCSAET
jgi:hypothetical protein